jgi:hypothetical protein
MLTRKIYRARENEGNIVYQPYDFSIQESFLKYRKGNIYNNFLREQFLRFPQKELFLDPSIPSASASRHFLPVDSEGQPIYKLRTAHKNVMGLEVNHYGGGTHILSQLTLESQAYVNKKEAKKLFGNNFISDKWDQHKDLQDYLMNIGYADAVELPLGCPEMTAFVDVVCVKDGVANFWDYKPEARTAKNKFACSQVWTQMQLFHEATGLPVNGGWFDEEDVYELTGDWVTYPEL